MRERGALAEASGQSRGTCEKKNLSPGKQGIYLENGIRPPCINICSPPSGKKIVSVSEISAVDFIIG